MRSCTCVRTFYGARANARMFHLFIHLLIYLNMWTLHEDDEEE